METYNLARKALGLDKRTFHGDIAMLAQDWEHIITDLCNTGDPSQVTNKLILNVSYSITLAYLRGRDIHLGNYKALAKHIILLGYFPTCIIMKVEEKGEAFFPILNKLGWGSLEKVIKILKADPQLADPIEKVIKILKADPQLADPMDIIAQAKQILEDKQY